MKISDHLFSYFKRIFYPILPYSFIRFYRNLIVYPKYQSLVQKNKKYKDLYKNETCYIIGNGPSLNQINLRPLKNKYTFVLNHFYKHPLYSFIKPNFHCYIDPDILKYLDPISDILAKNNSTHLFFNAQVCRNKKLQEKLKSDQYSPIFFKDIIRDQDDNLSINFSKPLLGGNFITYTVLMLALYMGFKKIYLLGFDHDWKKTNDQVVEDHFYNSPTAIKTKWSYHYLDPQYNYNVIYSKILSVAKDNSAKIINLNPNSLLDVFPKQNTPKDLVLKSKKR